MKLLKKITILLCFLSLIAFVSCSAEDKSGVKEKDNADGTEITGGGKSGNSGTDGGSGTGGSAGTGEGSGTGGSSGETSETGEGSGTGGTSETGGSSGTGGGTETTEEGNFYPPFGDYKDGKIGYATSSGEDLGITKVSKVDENTTKIKGHANSYGGARRFDFDISKWKKTIKDGKDIKSEAIEIKDNDNGYKDISIVYYYDSSTLEITLKSNYGDDYLFKGTKQP